MDRLRRVWPFYPATLRVGVTIELATGCALLAVPSVVVLAVAGMAGAADGWLLWPVVGVHGVLAAALVVGLLRVGRTS